MSKNMVRRRSQADGSLGRRPSGTSTPPSSPDLAAARFVKPSSRHSRLLDLPPELIALIIAFLDPSPAKDPHDGRFQDIEPRQTLRSLCLVHECLHKMVKPALYRRIVVQTMRQAFALEASLAKMEPEERTIVREIIFPLLKTTPCSPSRRGSPSISCLRAASLLKLLPEVKHIFFFDLRWEPKFDPDTTFDVFTSFKHLRKLSLYLGDDYRASLVLDELLPKLASCKSLKDLDLAATGTIDRDGFVDCDRLPPIESLTLIVSKPGRKGLHDIRFWPHFVGRLSPTLRHLATNVGDYLGQLIRRAGPRLLSLTMTPFTESYEADWWTVSTPSLRFLSLGWQGWDDDTFDPASARACSAVEVAIIGGYDHWRRDKDEAMQALLRVLKLPALRTIVATELNAEMVEQMEAEVRRRRPSVIFHSVRYGEVDMGALAERDVVTYKYKSL